MSRPEKKRKLCNTLQPPNPGLTQATIIPRTSHGTSWSRLPEEIQLMILEALLHDGCALAPFATVSRQWRRVIEKHTFSRIKLTISRLSDFGAMTRRNRALVRYLWLCLELEKYDCEFCVRRPLNNPDSALFANTIQRLFSDLSTWEPRTGTGRGIVLDISVHSPSDSEHWFKYLTFEPDLPFPNMEPRNWTTGAGAGITRQRFDDHRHGWVAGRRVTDPCDWALKRVFNDVMGFISIHEQRENEWWAQLPSVPAVTGVLLRQQNRRIWDPFALAKLLSHFPRLESLQYEPWRVWQGWSQQLADTCYVDLLESLTAAAASSSSSSSSSSVRRLVLFENFNQYYPAMINRSRRRSGIINFGQEYCDPTRVPAASVGSTLAKTSLTLEHLSASYLVDAQHFFEAAYRFPSWEWPNLTSLALTSQLLTPTNQDPTATTQLFCRAAAVAQKMPKLTVMEIWNGRWGLAMLFRYEASKATGWATITQRGTWELEKLEPCVLAAWDAAALTHGCREKCIVVDEPVPPLAAGQIECHGDAIRHLRLLCEVIRPISLQQICMEQRICDGALRTDRQAGRGP